LRRHQELSIRAPEPTSAARAMGFNKPVVQSFYQLLMNCIQKHNYGPDRIYNVDETGLSCVAKSQGKIIASKGRKQVGKLSSAERGQNVTATICFSASGHYVPPLLIFPRKRLVPSFLDGTPPSTYGVAHPSGWMQSEIFVEWMHHFIKHTNPTISNPVLLLLDGHATHVKNIPVIDIAKKHHITILCFPPHTTHKLQPLDISFMRPLSTYYSQEVNLFLVNHPERVITIYDIGKIFGLAYNKSATISNAVSGFKKAGIVPYNPDIFSDFDFMAASTTETPYLPDISNTVNQIITGEITLLPNTTNTANQSMNNETSWCPDTYNIIDETINNVSPLSPATIIASIDQFVYDDTILADETILADATISADEAILVDKTTPEASVIVSKSTTSFSVSPKDILRIPHTTRTKSTRNTRRGKTAVIIDSPYKKDLESKIVTKTKTNNDSKKKTARKLFGKPQKNKIKYNSSSVKVIDGNVNISNEQDATDECIYCTEPYNTGSKSGEKWARCIGCAKWCHELCGGVEDWTSFICDFCRTNISKT